MKLTTIKVGYLECNCYILSIDNQILVVDPGDDYKKIKEELKDKKVLGILITHNHFDHVGAVEDLVNDYNVEVYSANNLKEQEYNIGPFTFEVINTPGHTPDSITFYFKKDNIMFVGDFIFYDSIGRCDLEGGNYAIMQKSIDKIKKYDSNITIYPGHGINTTLKREIENNPYFNM